MSERMHALDDDVHVGSDGWLFLVRGSNSVIDLYRNESSFTDELARQWVELLRARNDRFSARGIRYVHLAAPEKLTLLHRHYISEDDSEPLENPGGSPLLQLVDRYDWDTPSLLNVATYLASQIDNYPVYWKTDTHWSAWGCFLAYQVLCSHLHIPVNEQILNYPFVEGPLVMDLGSKVEPPPQETARFYKLERHSRRVYANELVRYKEANGLIDEGSLHVGSHVIYRNDSPDAADKVVVLFGDSFSEYRNHLLSGMLAETVRELHFIWNANVDDEYVRRVRPDIVITELAERFMTRVPTDNLDIASLGKERVELHQQAAAKRAWAGERVERPVPVSRINTTRILPSESYPLPGMASLQANCDHAAADTCVTSKPVDLVEAFDTRIYFSGERCLVTAPGGETIARYGVDDARAQRVADEQYRVLSGTTMLLGDSPGAYSYYHWIMDILAKFSVLERAGIARDSINHFLIREQSSAFHAETLAHFGILPERVVETVGDQYLHAERLLQVDLRNTSNMTMHRSLPVWLKHAFPHVASTEPRLKLYLSRPGGVRRGVANEAELLPILERHGFTVLAMEGLSVQEQVQLMARVDVLVSPHGAGLTNMIFCRPGIQVVELLGRHVYPYYYGLASACGHSYLSVLENPQADYARLVSNVVSQQFAAPDIQATTVGQNFTVDVEAFEQTLVEALAQA